MNFKNIKQFGFSLTEALLAMVILVIIFAAAISNFKSQIADVKVLSILKQNTYTEIQGALLKVSSMCADKTKQTYELYKDCDKSKGKYTDSEYENGTALKETLSKFLNGTSGVCDNLTIVATNMPKERSLKLKNGICLYFPSNDEIFVDVNGSNSPNTKHDRMSLAISNLKITTDLQYALNTGYYNPLNSCTQFGACPECNEDGCICYSGYRLTESGCVSCGGPCNECNESGCTKCREGYRVSGGSCVRCPDNCDSCNESGCTKCYGGYGPHNGSCVWCANIYSGCNDCNESGCIRCDNNYRLSNGNCIYSRGCIDYNESGCTKCSNGYRLSGGSCVSCGISNCQECNESGCTKCYGSYKLSGGSCVSCGANCSECDESGCTKCWSYPPCTLSNGVCVSCTSNCSTCNAAGCTKCYSGYTLTDGTCVRNQ